MRKKPIVTAVIAALTFCLCIVFAGCDGKTPEQQPAVTQNTQTFIGLVAKVGSPVTLDAGGNISAAILLYDVLNDAEKANADVVAAKQKLDGYKAEYDAVKAAADEQAAREKEERAAQRFIAAVAQLPDENKLKLSDREAIDSAYALYELLRADTQATNDVVIAHGKLESANARVTELEEAARLLIIKETAEEFIEAVGELDEITLDSEATIKTLLNRYSNFEDEVKEYAGVAEAKSALDAAAAECKVLRDDDDVEKFLQSAAALGSAENITLDRERDLLKAESDYGIMSDEAKQYDGVAEAYEAVKAARAKYDELFAVAEQARIEQFIAAANAVGTNISEVDITWFDVLDAAGTAYFALTYDSQSKPEVKEAFERWNSAQKAFDAKGYKRIPMSDPNILYSGDYPPHLVLQNEANMINPLLEFYGVGSLSELDGKLTVWLNVYVNGEYVARGAINPSALGHIVQNGIVQGVMRELAAEYDEIQSGGMFGFALSFEDKAGEFIPSKATKVSADKTYVW